MISENDIQVGVKVQQLNGTKKVRTIVPDLKLPLRDHPEQRMPNGLEVTEQTVRLNPHMFQVHGVR